MDMLEKTVIFSKRLRSALNRDIELTAGSARVAKGAIINNSVIGEECEIGEGAVIENSVVLPRSIIRNTVIKNSIVDGAQIYKI